MATTSEWQPGQGADPEELTAIFLCNLIQKAATRSVVLDIVRNEHLTLQDLIALTEKLPVFDSARWEEVALTLGLDPAIDKYQLPPFSIPYAYLPPSFHKRVMKDSVQWLDIYKERGSQNRGNARVRLMDAVRLTDGFLFYMLTGLFSGTSQSAPSSKAVWLTSPKPPCPECQKPLRARLHGLHTKFT